jgi:hypothetical protein
MQEEWCCFLAQAPFEHMHGLHFNVENNILQKLLQNVSLLPLKIKENFRSIIVDRKRI